MRVVIYSFFLFLSILSNAQPVQFVLMGNVEPDYFDRMVADDSTYYAISKIRGSSYSSTEYSLNSYGFNFSVNWEVSLKLPKNENIVHFQFQNNECRVFINEFNTKEGKSLLKANRYDPVGGKLITVDTLFQENISDWMSYGGKGAVKQSFNNVICSKQQTNSVTPLSYRYYFKPSPDLNKTMVYRYDFSKKKLETQVRVFNDSLSFLGEAIIPVDHMYLVFDYAVNNKGEVFIAKANRGGKVAVIKYDLLTHDYEYLEIEMNNYQRDNLKMVVHEDDVIYLTKLNKIRGELQSMSFSVFDFETEKIDKHNTYPVTEELKTQILEQEKSLGYDFKEEWKNFRVKDVWTDTLGATYVVLEEQSIESVTFEYDEQGVEEKTTWFPEEAQVRCGTLILFKVNEDRSLAWVNFIVKQQLTDVSDGLNTVSYRVSQHAYDNAIDVLYAESTNGIVMNKLKLVQISSLGEIGEVKEIENPNKLVLLRSYFIDQEEGIVWVGKKGVLGKKSFIQRIVR